MVSVGKARRFEINRNFLFSVIIEYTRILRRKKDAL
jgi:hypothetical protein